MCQMACRLDAEAAVLVTVQQQAGQQGLANNREVTAHRVPGVCLCCWRSAGISYRGEPPDLTSYEKASAFFIFLNMLLAGLATIFGERSS